MIVCETDFSLRRQDHGTRRVSIRAVPSQPGLPCLTFSSITVLPQPTMVPRLAVSQLEFIRNMKPPIAWVGQGWRGRVFSSFV